MEKRANFNIFTDGACSGNPGPGGAAYIILSEKDMVISKGSRGYRHTTNQRMEVKAVILALEHVLDNNVGMTGGKSSCRFTIHTDSQYVFGTMTMGWKRKSNTDLWEQADRLISDLSAKGAEVTFNKVQGHAGNKYNNTADTMAVAAAKMPYCTDEGYEEANPFRKPASYAVTIEGEQNLRIIAKALKAYEAWQSTAERTAASSLYDTITNKLEN